jgi:hypothetical protein
VTQRKFGAAFVQTLMDQARYARGLSEPAEPVLTGNTLADNLVVEPHALETYDELFDTHPADDNDAPEQSDD